MNEKSSIESESKEVFIPKIGDQKNNLGKYDPKSGDINLPVNNENSIRDWENSNLKLNSNLVDTKLRKADNEKDLSDGEASSGFETVSSVDDNVDLDEIVNLNTEFDEDDISVIVQVENERGRRACYWKDKNKTSDRYSSRTDVSSNDYSNRRHDSSRTSNKDKSWQSRSKEKSYKYDKREKKSAERDFSRKLSSRDCDWSRNNVHCSSYRNKRIDHDRRSRDSRSSEWSHRSRASRSMERSIRGTSPGCKDRKTEARYSGSFEKNTTKSNLKRNSPPRKRRSSYSKSPPSVWKRLDSRTSPGRTNGEKMSSRNSSRKKERTPFLVELERKLKEAERMKNETTNGSLGKKEIPMNVSNAQPVPELPIQMNQNIGPSYMPMYVAPTPNIPEVGFPLQLPPLPTLSVNNLPLVPGPTGLPVHITVTGEQILHDLDGRPIPVGPNGYYLPLDPTGRLFPHIVSPGNQAVPIHMTEDGVLRLPNSEPVPYGPSHQLPVNVDGRIILIGPDSKPLYPCLDLPRHPPLHLLNMLNLLGTENTERQKVIRDVQHAENKDTVGTELQQGPSNNPDNFKPPEANSALEVAPQKTNTTDLLKKCKKKVRDSCNNVLKSIKIGDNLKLSKGGVKRSTPMKVSHKKTFKEDRYRRGIKTTLGSKRSDSASRLKFMMKPKKDAVEEIILSSDDEQGKLQTICDKKSSKSVDSNKDTKNLIVKKVKHAIKSLCEKNYKPPVFGRLFLSNLEDSVVRKSPNESPLLRNRLILPFLDPNAETPREKDELSKKTVVTFKFLPQKKSENGEKPSNVETQNENLNAEKLPVFTFDFAMQCDFTSVTIKNLTSKVAELEMEVVRLRNINANLLNGYKNVQAMNQNKGDELRKALLEIRERNSEIQSLKRSV